MSKLSGITSATIITIIMVFVTANLNWNSNASQSVLEADAKGYYAYLPAIFIYQDLNFGFFEEIEKAYPNKQLYYDYRYGANKTFINKYYCGTAIAQMPFFLLAHAYTSVTDFLADGYSEPYLYSVTIAALFYLFVGLFFFGKTLELFEVNRITRFIILAATVFGTNLFYYTVCEPGMSHIYSFAFISGFLYLSKRFFIKKEMAILGLVGVILGIIFLIRPLNILVVFALPFLSEGQTAFRESIQQIVNRPASLFVGALVFLVLAIIQPIIYKVSAGAWFIYSYGGEGFNFLSPHFIDILFSYKKGLFLYTPILFLSLIVAFWLWRKTYFQLVSYFGFFILLTYVLSSWWNWWYGGSFSSRVYVEYLPLLMLPLALCLNKSIGLKRLVLIGSILAFVAVCQIQTYQYRYYQIHWEDNSKESYWSNFLRIDRI